ncbi:MAG: serine/threonine-protein kinase [Xenococcaceae cyanobacterium MO_207.B15]|nr:serine/threonine-protein kinase [Xenococcaceae cyanobacterium MO_207.B15]
MSKFTIGTEEISFGTIIDNRYQIQKILGQGGLGRTYLAFDTHRFNEPCVLKEFAPWGSGQYDLEKSRDLFKREAKILHRISHPQIPKFLACFEGQGRLFLVQEFVNGKTYSQLLQERQKKQQAFSEQEIIKWLMDILPILDYIHEKGIIHRDISPDNIMQPEGEELPVLIDFGVGKLTNPNISQDSKLGRGHHSYVGKMSFVGKIGYAPREQISMGRCSPSSDLYSLGVTALVMLTGQEPTALLDQYSLEWQWQKYVRVSPGFAAFIDKMTEERPLERYQSAKETLKDLERYFADIDTIIQRTNPEKTTKSKSQQKLVAGHNQISPSAKQYLGAQPKSSHIEETMIVNPSAANSTSGKKDRQQPNLSSDNQPKNDTFFDDTMIVNPVYSNSSEIKSQGFNQKPQPNSLDSDFINLCHQELAYFIGPMANLILEEALAQKNISSPEALVNALAQQIPNAELQIKFKRRLLR